MARNPRLIATLRLVSNRAATKVYREPLLNFLPNGQPAEDLWNVHAR
jgi:hypothetical protein